MFQQVRQLLDVITKSVDTLEQACSKSKVELPSLDEPFQPALRDAASGTNLVVLEMIMPYACHDDMGDIANGITGAWAIKAPNPLLANWGAVNEIIYMLDMVVRFFLMSLCGC
jgi:hypothetical protein